MQDRKQEPAVVDPEPGALTLRLSQSRLYRDLGRSSSVRDSMVGDDGKLVRFYESAGFTRTEPFEVKGWPGQLLERSAP